MEEGSSSLSHSSDDTRLSDMVTADEHAKPAQDYKRLNHIKERSTKRLRIEEDREELRGDNVDSLRHQEEEIKHASRHLQEDLIVYHEGSDGSLEAVAARAAETDFSGIDFATIFDGKQHGSCLGTSPISQLDDGEKPPPMMMSTTTATLSKRTVEASLSSCPSPLLFDSLSPFFLNGSPFPTTAVASPHHQPPPPPIHRHTFSFTEDDNVEPSRGDSSNNGLNRSLVFSPLLSGMSGGDISRSNSAEVRTTASVSRKNSVSHGGHGHRSKSLLVHRSTGGFALAPSVKHTEMMTTAQQSEQDNSILHAEATDREQSLGYSIVPQYSSPLAKASLESSEGVEGRAGINNFPVTSSVRAESPTPSVWDRIGPEYQAVMPDLLISASQPAGCVEHDDDNTASLSFPAQSSKRTSPHDEEPTLLWSPHWEKASMEDVAAATNDVRITDRSPPTSASHAAAAQDDDDDDDIAAWSSSEVLAFEEGVRICRKNFPAIREKYVPKRSVKEVVSFYYSHWKRSGKYRAWKEDKLLGRRILYRHVLVHDSSRWMSGGGEQATAVEEVLGTIKAVEKDGEGEDVFDIAYDDGRVGQLYRYEAEACLIHTAATTTSAMQEEKKGAFV